MFYARVNIGAQFLKIYNYRFQNAELDQKYETIIYGQQLHALREASPVADVKSVYLSVDKHSPKFKDSDIDFSYRSDAMPKKPFFPAVLCKFHIVPLMNTLCGDIHRRRAHLFQIKNYRAFSYKLSK